MQPHLLAMTLAAPLAGIVTYAVAGTGVMVLWPPAATDDIPTILVGMAVGLLLHLPVAWWLARVLVQPHGPAVETASARLRRAFVVYQLLVPPLVLVASYFGLFVAGVARGFLGLGALVTIPVLAYVLFAAACTGWLSTQSA